MKFLRKHIHKKKLLKALLGAFVVMMFTNALLVTYASAQDFYLDSRSPSYWKSIYDWKLVGDEVRYGNRPMLSITSETKHEHDAIWLTTIQCALDGKGDFVFYDAWQVERPKTQLRERETTQYEYRTGVQYVSPPIGSFCKLDLKYVGSRVDGDHSFIIRKGPLYFRVIGQSSNHLII